MIACKMYENNMIFSISENVMHRFEKVKFYLFHRNLRFPVSKQYICSHNTISCACHILSISNLFSEIEQRLLFKMVTNINGFVNRLLKTWTMLHTFQMPLVSKRMTEIVTK